MSGSWCLNSSKYMAVSSVPIGGSCRGRRARAWPRGRRGRCTCGRDASLTRRTEAASAAGTTRAATATSSAWIVTLGVRERLAIPARGGAPIGPDEGVVTVDDDPDDRPVSGPVRHSGLDLDLPGLRQQGKLGGLEAHSGNVAHIARARRSREGRRAVADATPLQCPSRLARHGRHPRHGDASRDDVTVAVRHHGIRSGRSRREHPAARPRRRRRATNHEARLSSPSARRASASSPRTAARRRSRRPRRSGPTSSCSTSSCPTSTASRSCASCASAGRSR